MRAGALFMAVVAALGVAASGAAAAPKVAAPAPVLGLSAPQISLTTAARMPDGSVLVGGRVGKHPLVARVRPSGVLDETFASGGRWSPRNRSGVVSELLVNDRGTQIDALVQHGLPDGDVAVVSDATFSSGGHLSSFRRYRSSDPGAFASTFYAAGVGGPLAVMQNKTDAGGPCSGCAVGPAGRDGAPPAVTEVTWPDGDACTSRPISDAIRLPDNRVLVSFFNDESASTNGNCKTGVGLLTGNAAQSIAPGPDAPTGGPWTFGAAIGGGQVCAGMVVLDSAVAVGPVTEADGVVSMPALRAVPASAGSGGKWIPTSVFSTGPSSCGAVLLGPGGRHALLLETRSGVSATRLPNSTSEPVAARCNDHVLVFNTARVGRAASVVVQAVGLGNASRERVAPPLTGPSLTGCVG